VHRVTVFTPAHDRKDWLPDCLESVAAQAYPHKRHVVVDDRSSDGTFEFVRSVMEAPRDLPPHSGAEAMSVGTFKGTRLAVARLEKNLGPSGARNWAMRACWDDTDVFGNLDSDDRYRDGYLDKLLAPFDHPEVGAVYCDYEVVNRQTGTLVREFKEPYSRRRLAGDCLLCNNSLVRKAALAEAGLYDEQLRVAEDWDLWLRVAEKYLLVHVPECLLELNAGPHGATAGVGPERWRADRQRVFQKLLHRART
jgi:cellulose synthase/poly-beta-1,6-N-acetylglucosamine synthase-like glycosyltransferase